VSRGYELFHHRRGVEDGVGRDRHLTLEIGEAVRAADDLRTFVRHGHRATRHGGSHPREDLVDVGGPLLRVRNGSDEQGGDGQ
jgi:hypothetical protein